MRIAWWAIAMFMSLGAILNGLYYELPLFTMNVLLTAAVLILWVSERRITLHYGSLFALGIVLLYTLTVLYGVDRQQAIVEAGRVFCILPLSILATSLRRDDWTKLLQLTVWLGAFLVLWGYAFGFVRNGRLESTLQYANALALFLLIATVTGLWFTVHTRRWLLLAPTLISLFGLIMTYSRFVLLLLPGALIASYLLYPALRRTRMGMQLMGGVGAVLLIGVAAGGSLLMERLAAVRWDAGELQLRLVYWKDAAGLWGRYFFTGTGGGGWPLLGPQGYFVKYVHNAYLQVAVDTGVLGVLLLLGWLGYSAIILLLQNRPATPSEFPLPRLALLLIGLMALHAGFDIDWTYPLLVGLLTVLLMAGTEGRQPWRVIELSSGVKRVQAAAGLSVLLLLFGYVSIGLGLKAQAVQLPGGTPVGERLQAYERAGTWLHWDHSVRMEQARIHTLLWNQYHRPADWTSARDLLRECVRLSPKNQAYQKQYEKFILDSPNIMLSTEP